MIELEADLSGLLAALSRSCAETLKLMLGADQPRGAEVLAYDFREYRSRYGADPADPRYIAILKRDLDSNPVALNVDISFRGEETTVTCLFEAGAVAGTWAAVRLPAGSDSTLRLARVRQDSQSLRVATADLVAVVVTLGNIIDLSSLRAMAGLLTAPYQRGAEMLELTFGADAPSGTEFLPYDFREYRARYGPDPPPPRYIVVLKQNLGHDPVSLEVDMLSQGVETTASCRFSSEAFAGMSVALPLPASADATLRLLRIRQIGYPAARASADSFVVLALCGNIAKLLWVLGWEKDLIRAHLKDVAEQRMLTRAHGASLDLRGQDLRVPRFPPREHSFDADTIAFYHLNDEVADGGTVIDETVRFGRAGHPGINKGAESLAAGKFATGFRFPGKSGAIHIADDAAFALPPAASFTVELFANADKGVDPAPRMLVVKGKLNGGGALIGAGWSLAVGHFRGIGSNVRWTVFDGTDAIEIFADLSVSGGFHHVAGTIDRKKQRIRLFIDGVERASAEASALGALTNTEDIHIGGRPTGPSFSGLVDEVRFSSVAREEFHPVLGEGDEPYRRRLGIFERWILPTAATIADTINGAVRIQGDPKSFMLVDRDRPTVIATQSVRLVPKTLAPGESIDAGGNGLASEASACGLPEDDRDFDPIYLHTHHRPKVDYGADAGHAHMQAAAVAALDDLLDRIAALNVSGNLIIDLAYDAAGSGLHRVGRALDLRHESLTASTLAALAHRAGFAFVHTDGSTVTAAVAKGEKLAIGIEDRPSADTPPAGMDVFVGKAVDLELLPSSLPSAGEIRWILIRSGNGNGRFVAHPADPATLKTPITTRARIRFRADAPGEIVVRVEFAFRRQIVQGTRRLLISIESLNDQATIAADGNTAIDEVGAVGAVEPAPINPIYLVTSAIPGVTYGADPNNTKMQITLDRAFAALVRGTAGLATGLTVLKAFDPNDEGLHRTGRALIMTHATVASGTLGALAHRAGFGFVRHQGNQIYASVAAGERIDFVRSEDLAPLPDELEVGEPVGLATRADVKPDDRNFTWTLLRGGQGDGAFNYLLRPSTTFIPKVAGKAVLALTYLEPDELATDPYTFEIRLNPKLEAADAIIPKDSYDVVMNVLNAFHPVGVEVVTGGIRKHVKELEFDPHKAFPLYTFPDFRDAPRPQAQEEAEA